MIRDETKDGEKMKIGYATSLKIICKNDELYASWFSSTADFRGIMVKS